MSVSVANKGHSWGEELPSGHLNVRNLTRILVAWIGESLNGGRKCTL